jgi:hypothetical protein
MDSNPQSLPSNSRLYARAINAIAIAGIILGMIFVYTAWGDLLELRAQADIAPKARDQWLRVGQTALWLGLINLLAGAACLRWHALHAVPAIAAILTALGWGMWALALT